MPSLEVVSPVEGEVAATYSFDNEPGATVSISGFHGTQTYTLSEHDQTLVIRFTNVTGFTESAPAGDPQKQRAAVPEGAPEGEKGAEESDAEAAQRTAAEAAAKKNDAKKEKRVTLVDDQGTARTYVMVDEDSPKASLLRLQHIRRLKRSHEDCNPRPVRSRSLPCLRRLRLRSTLVLGH